MEWSWRTVLILIGLLVMVAILIDGFRRMRRARAEALRLDVGQHFRFPDDEHNPELPGAVRVVNKATAPAPAAEHSAADEDDALLGFRSAQQRAAAAQEPLRHTIQEPVFTELDGNFSTEEEPVIPWDDELSPVRVVKSAVVVKPAPAPTVSIADNASASEDDALAADAAQQHAAQDGLPLRHSQEIHVRAAQARREHPVEDLDIPPSPLIPKARPVNLDEQFPVLLDVEELGDDDIKPQIDHQAAEELRYDNAAEAAEHQAESSEPVVAATGAEASTADADDLTAENDPHLEDEVDTLPSELPLQPVNFAGANAERLASRGIPELVLEIHAIARDPAGFSGKDILFLFNSCDLRFGEKDIFHRFEQADGEGCIQFSVAQSYEPGIFVPAAMAQQHFRGLSFFMSLPGAKNPREAYEAMSEMALVVARKLRADVYDGARSALTPQTMEHDRQQIMDFERRQRLALKKQAKGASE
ncbi:MAG: hypothetical protein LRY72_16125 [Saccharospirillaceae bacterium]|nr:hypothetical protein [Saccharospirillaceae bacterium]